MGRIRKPSSNYNNEKARHLSKVRLPPEEQQRYEREAKSRRKRENEEAFEGARDLVFQAEVVDEDTRNTLDEAKREAMVALLISRSASTNQIVKLMIREFPEMSAKRIREMEAKVIAGIDQRFRDSRGYSRALQANRLHQLLFELHNVPAETKQVLDPNGRKVWKQVPGKKALTAILRTEELIAELEGNLEPLKVNVNYGQTQIDVLRNMSDERRAKVLEHAKERQRLAQLGATIQKTNDEPAE